MKYENMLTHIELENFKSISKIKLDLSSINIFIGQNRSGKSSVFQAFGLLKQSPEQNIRWNGDAINLKDFENVFNKSSKQDYFSIFMGGKTFASAKQENALGIHKIVFGYRIKVTKNDVEELGYEISANEFNFMGNSVTNQGREPNEVKIDGGTIRFRDNRLIHLPIQVAGSSLPESVTQERITEIHDSFQQLVEVFKQQFENFVFVPPTRGFDMSTYQLSNENLESIPTGHGLTKQTEQESLERLSKSGIKKGNRHNSALRYCNLLLFTQKLDSHTVRFEIRRWNLKLKPPLPDEEINKIVDDCINFHKENKTSDGVKVRDREPKGIHNKIAESIMSKYNFRTLVDTEEILVYEHGVYRPYGKIKVKEECQIEKKECYNNLVAEVIGTVQRLTYTPREKFDGYPNLLNLTNGVLDIEKNNLAPHDAKYLFRVQLPIEYKPDAKPEKIMKFLNEILDPEFCEWVLDFIAYCLVRNCKQEKALMLVGLGGNGKSTLLNLIIKFLGLESISTHSVYELTSDRFAQASLDGKLANIHSDIESNEIKRTGILKQLISGDSMSVQKKNQDPYTMKPFAKLVFSTNQMPDVTEEPEAFFQRWLVIDFIQTFRGTDKENKNLIDELTTDEELSGLLNVIMKRMPKLISNSGIFENAPNGYELKQTWKDHANSVESFINNEIEFDKNYKIVKKDLFKIYQMYCEKKKFKSIREKTFSSRFNESLGSKIDGDVAKIKGKSVRVWKNIRVKNMPQDENQQKLDDDSHPE